MNKPFPMRPVAHACALVLSLATLPVNAQERTVLESVVVTGDTPVDATIKPLTVLDNAELNKTGAPTLGDALQRTPGVSVTGFGPNASRPIIRGQDGDRVKILRNSSPTIDASTLSYDHALTIDPLTIQQVEILRGPAALAYGGNAVAGAINLVDQRIARSPLTGVSGGLTLLGEGATRQNGAGLQLGVGLGKGWSLTVDGTRRRSGDLRTPNFTDPGADPTTPADDFQSRRVGNSSAQSRSAGAGLSWGDDRGYVGVSTEETNQNYGVPKALDVRIGMTSRRNALEGQRTLGGFVEQVKYRIAQTDYQHQEFEGGAPATLFSNRGLDGRVELVLSPSRFGNYALRGTTGLQFERSDFSALGDEAFVPSTTTRSTGAFYVAQLKSQAQGAGQWELGLRSDQVSVDAASTGTSPLNGPVAGAGVTGGPAESRNFNPNSVSLGYQQPLTGGWTVGGSAARIERAPTSFELFADGVHVATDSYEKGNPTLKEERANHVELNTGWASGAARFKANLFQTRYANYIALIGRPGAGPGGLEQFDNMDPADPVVVPVYDFRAVPATFKGLELSAGTSLNWAGWRWSPQLQYDRTRANRRDGGGALPRIAPQRVLGTLDIEQGGWRISPSVEWRDSSPGAANDPATDAYTLVNVGVNRRINLGGTAADVFVNLNNLTDELAYSASTIATVRRYTPLAGRSALMGVRWQF